MCTSHAHFYLAGQPTQAVDRAVRGRRRRPLHPLPRLRGARQLGVRYAGHSMQLQDVSKFVFLHISNIAEGKQQYFWN